MDYDYAVRAGGNDYWYMLYFKKDSIFFLDKKTSAGKKGISCRPGTCGSAFCRDVFHDWFMEHDDCMDSSFCVLAFVGWNPMQDLIGAYVDENCVIVLDHQPNDQQAQAEAKADLVLSGHTHAGQFFPINGMGEWFGLNDMTYGLKKQERTNFIVSSGIADWALKFRTGCRSEYFVVDICGK